MSAFSQPDSVSASKFTSISPSAYALIQLKSHTTIPFAKETAALLSDARTDGKVDFRMLIHFENRYRTVDEMIRRHALPNLLEFSSGLSFRGLDLCLNPSVHFIDTDLPDVVATKHKLLDSLVKHDHLKLTGNLQVVPLNVFDVQEFERCVKLLPPGPILLINEGLLPYFDIPEKKKLCDVISGILKQRGGYWITADVYVKTNSRSTSENGDSFAQFRKDHKLNENRFESYAAAEEFFAGCGLEVVDKESWVLDQLSCLRVLSDEKRKAVIAKLKSDAPIRQTWCLGLKK